MSLNVKLDEYYLSGTENLSDPVLENLKNIRVFKLLKFHWKTKKKCSDLFGTAWKVVALQPYEVSNGFSNQSPGGVL